jgi:hypothetical protein
MKLYTVHYRHADAKSLAGLADGAVLVREGFSWPAFVFGPFWLALRGMWIVLAVYAAAMTLLVVLARSAGLPETAVSILTSALNLLLGFEGNDLYRWSLARRRCHERAVVSGRDQEEAEARFFASLTASHRHHDLEAT